MKLEDEIIGRLQKLELSVDTTKYILEHLRENVFQLRQCLSGHHVYQVVDAERGGQKLACTTCGKEAVYITPAA